MAKKNAKLSGRKPLEGTPMEHKYYIRMHESEVNKLKEEGTDRVRKHLRKLIK